MTKHGPLRAQLEERLLAFWQEQAETLADEADRLEQGYLEERRKHKNTETLRHAAWNQRGTLLMALMNIVENTADEDMKHLAQGAITAVEQAAREMHSIEKLRETTP